MAGSALYGKHAGHPLGLVDSCEDDRSAKRRSDAEASQDHETEATRRMDLQSAREPP